MRISIIPFVIFILCAFTGNHAFSAFFMLTVGSFIWLFSKGIAVADIIILVGCANFIPIEHMGLFLISIGVSSSIFGIVSKKMLKKEEFPMVPFIMIGLLIVKCFT